MAESLKYLAVASEFMTEKKIESINQKYFHLLAEQDIERFSESDIETEKDLIYFVISGGVENKILTLIEKRNRKYPLRPIILLTYPENNSLPAAFELLASLNQKNQTGRIFYLSSDHDKDTVAEIHAYLKDFKNSKPLENHRIGLIGLPSDWLIASSPEFSIVKQVWGAEVALIDIDILIKKFTRLEITELIPEQKMFCENATSINGPNREDLLNSGKVYAALKEIIDEYRLDSISLRCFDLVTQLNTTGCYALAKLNNENISASCEGDLVSHLTMLWVKKTTGQNCWMANPARIDLKNNTLTLAHCTISFDLISSYSILSHFESGTGVGIKGCLPLIPVTIVRIGGKDLNRLWITAGKITRNLQENNLCRTQIDVHLADNSFLNELLKNPPGNHLMMIPGKYQTLLQNNWIQSGRNSDSDG
ncbi:MAG: hypothetical protein APR54_07405 [Candidatus Cloacimonas sp. SDB]|nr:MAG: hypothetical protein APR54_07405 [Candidatus Cloacimonas sp. SDB]